MHFLIVTGMLRRVFDFPDVFYVFKTMVLWGFYVSVISYLFFFYVVFNVLARKRRKLLTFLCDIYLIFQDLVVNKTFFPNRFFVIFYSLNMFISRRYLCDYSVILRIIIPIIVFVVFYLFLVSPIYFGLKYPYTVGVPFSRILKRHSSYVYFEISGGFFYDILGQLTILAIKLLLLGISNIWRFFN